MAHHPPASASTADHSALCKKLDPRTVFVRGVDAHRQAQSAPGLLAAWPAPPPPPGPWLPPGACVPRRWAASGWQAQQQVGTEAQYMRYFHHHGQVPSERQCRCGHDAPSLACPPCSKSSPHPAAARSCRRLAWRHRRRPPAPPPAPGPPLPPLLHPLQLAWWPGTRPAGGGMEAAKAAISWRATAMAERGMDLMQATGCMWRPAPPANSAQPAHCIVAARSYLRNHRVWRLAKRQHVLQCRVGRLEPRCHSSCKLPLACMHASSKLQASGIVLRSLPAVPPPRPPGRRAGQVGGWRPTAPQGGTQRFN